MLAGRERSRSFEDSLTSWSNLKLCKQLDGLYLNEWRSWTQIKRKGGQWVKLFGLAWIVNINNKKTGSWSIKESWRVQRLYLKGIILKFLRNLSLEKRKRWDEAYN